MASAPQAIRGRRRIVRSSNYTLYGDMSSRVMTVLSQFTPDLEIYSIDEAFLGGFETRLESGHDVHHWSRPLAAAAFGGGSR